MTTQEYGYIYDGNVVTQQIFDPNDSRSQDIVGSNILESILRNPKPSISIRYAPTNLADAIRRAYTNNYATKVAKFYDYGKFEHSDWLPSNSVTHYFDDHTEGSGTNYAAPHPDVETAIEEEVEEDVNITWYSYGYPNWVFIFNAFLLKSNIYNLHGRGEIGASRIRFIRIADDEIFIPWRFTEADGILTAYCYRTRFFYATPEDGIPSQWLVDRTTEIPITVDLSFHFPDVNPFPNDGLAGDVPVHMAAYKRTSTGDYGAWIYAEDGTHPNIDGSMLLPHLTSGSYPFAMIVEDGLTVSKNHLGEQYRIETEELLSEIDLNLNDLMEQLIDPTPYPDGNTDEFGNIKDLKDCFISFSANIELETEGTLQYLYEHFRDYYYHTYIRQDLYHSNWNDNVTLGNPQLGGRSSAFYNTNRVSFSTHIRWMRISWKTGNVNDFDQYSGIFGPSDPNYNNAKLNDLSFTNPFDGTNHFGGYGKLDENNDGSTYYTNNGNGDRVQVGKVVKTIIQSNVEYAMDEAIPHLSINEDYMILRKQYDAESYVEIVVFGPFHQTYVTGWDFGQQRGSDYVLTSLNNMEDGKFFIPLSYDVVQKFNTILQSRVFYETLSITFHTYNVTDLPWYANENLMAGIRVILFALTWGSSEIWVEGVFAVLQQFVLSYAIQLIVIEVLDLLVGLVGGEAALIIAAIAATVAAVSGITDIFDNFFNLISAEQLMQGATLLIQSVKNQVNDDFLNLQREQEEHQEAVEREQERIESIEAQLSKGIDLDLLKVIVRPPLFDPYETPQDFYNRTVHMTNPGVLSLDTIDSYTENLLKLPEAKPKHISVNPQEKQNGNE